MEWICLAVQTWLYGMGGWVELLLIKLVVVKACEIWDEMMMMRHLPILLKRRNWKVRKLGRKWGPGRNNLALLLIWLVPLSIFTQQLILPKTENEIHKQLWILKQTHQLTNRLHTILKYAKYMFQQKYIHIYTYVQNTPIMQFCKKIP